MLSSALLVAQRLQDGYEIVDGMVSHLLQETDRLVREREAEKRVVPYLVSWMNEQIMTAVEVLRFWVTISCLNFP